MGELIAAGGRWHRFLVVQAWLLIVVGVVLAVVAVFAHVIPQSSWQSRQFANQPNCVSRADLGLPPDPRFDRPKPAVCDEAPPGWGPSIVLGVLAAGSLAGGVWGARERKTLDRALVEVR